MLKTVQAPGNVNGAIELYNVRDVAGEVNDLNQLQKLGITPKVEAFNINPDGLLKL